MKEDRGKRVMEWDGFESRCRRHPGQKQGSGICPLCLMDRLNGLFCPDCGELRPRHSSASSCSCSEASTSSSSADCLKKKGNNNNSNGGCGGGGGSGSVEVGSVGRISFLIESERPEFDSLLMLRRSKSAAVGSTRTAEAVVRTARTPPPVAAQPVTPRPTPKALPTKKWYAIFSFVLKKKKKGDGGIGKESVKVSSGEDRIVVEQRLVKSKSVAVGRRSFSGYFWENGGGHADLKVGNTNVFCTPAREVKGSNRGEIAQPRRSSGEIAQPRRSSGRGWSWAFSSPMRAFKHSKAAKSRVATNNPPSPCSVAEMCRG